MTFCFKLGSSNSCLLLFSDEWINQINSTTCCCDAHISLCPCFSFLCSSILSLLAPPTLLLTPAKTLYKTHAVQDGSISFLHDWSHLGFQHGHLVFGYVCFGSFDCFGHTCIHTPNTSLLYYILYWLIFAWDVLVLISFTCHCVTNELAHAPHLQALSLHLTFLFNRFGISMSLR